MLNETFSVIFKQRDHIKKKGNSLCVLDWNWKDNKFWQVFSVVANLQMFGLFPVSQVAYLAPEVNLASMQCFHSWWTWLTAPEGYDHLHWLSVDPRLSPLVGTPIGDFQRWRPHASNFHHSTRKSTFRTFSFLPSTLFDQFIDWPDFSPFFYLSYFYGLVMKGNV